ncbi:recombinase family protein [Paenibacillus odorifer]|uniref:Recombinase domain-containing protein n=1 Tax=Paenibacillus odorifer TaxID=189426 RepID=A0A1R0Y026_9BACL|nr:recombinase family protein [Paenibacillus odorifer]OMD40701.1 hypothetical protein BSK52_12590 [Paenibacillus odorifer]
MKTIEEVLGPGSKKGVFYGRESSDKQDADMKTQKHMAYSLVEKYKCEIVREYVDTGVSAYKKKMEQRAGLMEMLDDLDKNKVDFVVVFQGDRLARNPMEHFKIRAFMNAREIYVIQSSGQDLYNSGDLLGQLMKDGYSKYEADNISTRTRDDFETRISKGIYNGGGAPFGYRYLGNHQFKIMPDEKIVVKNIFELYKSGQGFQSIAEILMTDKNTKDIWCKETVKSIITNPFYMGYLTFGRVNKSSRNSINDKSKWTITRFKGIEPIITQEEWEQCWEIYKKKSQGDLPPKHFKTSYLFKGVIYCKDCKQPLMCKDQRTKDKGKPYGSRVYKCPNRNCGLSYRADDLHEFIINDILPSVYIKARTAPHETLHEEILSSLKKDANQLLKDIKELEEQVADYIIELSQAESRVLSLYQESIESNETELMILIEHRMRLKKWIEGTKHVIDKKTKRIQYINHVESDFEIWKDSFLGSVLEEYDLQNDTKLRRLILYIFEKVEISKNWEINYTTRIDLEGDAALHVMGSFLENK